MDLTLTKKAKKCCADPPVAVGAIAAMENPFIQTKAANNKPCLTGVPPTL